MWLCAIVTLIIYPSSLYEATSFSVLLIENIFRVTLSQLLNVLLCKTEQVYLKNSALFYYDNVRKQFILAPESLSPERMLIFTICPQAVDCKDASMYVYSAGPFVKLYIGPIVCSGLKEYALTSTS